MLATFPGFNPIRSLESCPVFVSALRCLLLRLSYASMRPVRRSSEGPEVVPSPRVESPDKYLVPFSDRFNRPSTIFQQKLSEEPEEEHPSARHPQHPVGRDDFSYVSQEDGAYRRSFGLLTIVLLSLLAFLVGGGIGGGVGGAIAVKNQDKISR